MTGAAVLVDVITHLVGSSFRSLSPDSGNQHESGRRSARRHPRTANITVDIPRGEHGQAALCWIGMFYNT